MPSICRFEEPNYQLAQTNTGLAPYCWLLLEQISVSAAQGCRWCTQRGCAQLCSAATGAPRCVARLGASEHNTSTRNSRLHGRQIRGSYSREPLFATALICFQTTRAHRVPPSHLRQHVLLLHREWRLHGGGQARLQPRLLQQLLGHGLVVHLVRVDDAHDQRHLVVVRPHLRRTERSACAHT